MTIGSLADGDGGGGIVTNADTGDSVLTTGGDNSSTAFSGVIQDGVHVLSLTKVGTGQQILSGANTYTGATTVNGGLLRIDGSILTSVAVNTGGTLGGNGTTGAVNINAGGTLAAGASAGILNTGSIALVAGAFFEAEIGGSKPGVGGYDQVKVTGTVDLGGATLDALLLGGFVPGFGDAFVIIDNDGNDTVAGTFAGLAEGARVDVDGSVMAITYRGGDGNDVALLASITIIGTDGADLVDATNTVPGQPLPTAIIDLIKGKGGKDDLSGLGGDDTIKGGRGGDMLNGDAGSDSLLGQRGHDRMYGGDDGDLLKGGKGGDRLNGDAGADTLNGGAGRDKLAGGDDDDLLKGGKGGDRLNGDAGADTLDGGPGRDKLTGGDDDDTFVFANPKQPDQVMDWADGDVIALKKSAFPGIGPKGVLDEDLFHIGPEAFTTKEKILYDADTGWLLWAADGSDTANPLAFAKIGKYLDDFNYSDIMVI